MRRARAIRAALWLGLFALSACTSTETGNPPAQPDPGLNPLAIQFMLVPGMGDPGLISGVADSDVPPGASLRVTPMDTVLPTLTLTLEGDPPAFSSSLEAGYEGWLRLQIVHPDGELRRPLDIVTGDVATGPVEPLPAPVGPCLQVETDLTLGPDGTVQVAIANDCPGDLLFEDPSMRLGLMDLVPLGGFSLAVGQTATLEVRANGMTQPGSEDVLLLSETSGERRAVTIRN